MQNAGVKGVFSPVLVAIGLLVLLFIANSAVYNVQADKTFIKMQAARETTIKTENAVRIMDKSISYAMYNNRNDSSCKYTGTEAQINTAINDALAAFKTTSQANCQIAGGNTVTISSNETVTVQGTVACTAPVNGANITVSRAFNFNKTIGKDSGPPPKPCWVKDNISGCAEQPAFSCP